MSSLPHASPSTPPDAPADAPSAGFERLPAALFTWQPDPAAVSSGQWHWLGGALARELGLVGRLSLEERLAPAQLASLLRTLRLAAGGRGAWSCRLEIGSAAGPRTLQFAAAPQSAQAPWQGVAVESDVTALGQAGLPSTEAALPQLALGTALRDRQRSEARLAALVEEQHALLASLPLPVLLWRGGVLSAWNGAAERLFGWPVGTAIDPALHLPAELLAEAAALQERVLHGQTVNGVRSRRRCRDGTQCEVSLLMLPWRDARGNVAGSLTFLEDLDAQRREAMARERSGRALRRGLLRELEGRLKSALQDCAGVLRRAASREPALAPLLGETLAPLGALAALHGLRGLAGESGLAVGELASAVARAVERVCQARVPLILQHTGPGGCRLSGQDATAVALILNELALDALRESDQAPASRGAKLTVSESEAGVELRLLSPASSLARAGRDGAETVARVRALMPAQGATLRLQRGEGWVELVLTLSPPVVEYLPLEALAQDGETAG